MDALQSMETYLSTRPTGFASVASGIEWQYVLVLTHNKRKGRTLTKLAPDHEPFATPLQLEYPSQRYLTRIPLMRQNLGNGTQT